jgi:Protein phosphatase 2C
VRVMLATEPGTAGWPNEDFAAVAPGAAVLLDGATTFPRDADTGCLHGVAWYARNLGGTLLAAITAEPRISLADALAGAIAEVAARHELSCDLTSPATPAATVTAIRVEPSGIAYLALSDSTVAADYQDACLPMVISDTHRAARASPEAAHKARTGTLTLDGLRGIALLSDGAACIADRYHLIDWTTLLGVIRDHGPAQLIEQVRKAEAADQDRTRWPRHKANDDATVVWWQIAHP